MQVTILIPTRNGAEFLEWSYNSIRKNQGNHDVEILIFNDNSYKDNTNELLQRLKEKDSKLTVFSNTGERKGISGAYTFLAKQVKTKYLMHFHNDMYLCEGALDLIEKQFIEHGEKIAVCLTRIEHSMGYQPGPEKIIWDDAPLELEDWNEDAFLNDLPKLKSAWNNQLTGGHFAPFCMKTSVYHELGGVDDVTFPLQSREDSDWAFRLVLAGISTIQIPQFVFHFASRGNRRNKYETNTMTDNPQWVAHNMKATRNFLRKWGTLNLHDKYLEPSLPKLYNVGFSIPGELSSYQLLELLEPWCRTVWLEDTLNNRKIVNSYIESEQPNTAFDLFKRIVLIDKTKPSTMNDFVVTINQNRFTANDFNIIQQIQELVYRIAIDNTFKFSSFKVGSGFVTVYATETVDDASRLIPKDSKFLADQFLQK